MFHLTKHERCVLVSLALILLTGSILRYAFKKYPHLHNMVNLLESDRLYPKFNINSAAEEELVQIPYIGKYTARQIVVYRQQRGAFTSLEQLKEVPGIRSKNYERFKKYLVLNHDQF